MIGSAAEDRDLARSAGAFPAGEVRVDALPENGVEVVRVQTAEELRRACGAAFTTTDVLVMAAAVADFRPVAPDGGKIKKDGREGLTVELEATVDVLSELSARRRAGQVLVGFAAEHGDGAIVHARGKLQRKGLDAVVLNDVSVPGIAFDADDNAITIVTAGREETVDRAPKAQIADAILDAILRLDAAPPASA